MLQSIKEFYRVLQSITEYYRVLQSITKTNLAHLLGPFFGLVLSSLSTIYSRRPYQALPWLSQFQIKFMCRYDWPRNCCLYQFVHNLHCDLGSCLFLLLEPNIFLLFLLLFLLFYGPNIFLLSNFSPSCVSYMHCPKMMGQRQCRKRLPTRESITITQNQDQRTSICWMDRRILSTRRRAKSINFISLSSITNVERV